MMKILITNDDGIESPVLPLLAKWAAGLGEVTVCAPKVEQSGKSQAINFRSAIEITQVDFCDGIPAYSVDSTPADCVRFGLHGLKKRYDLIISGINRGYNLGDDIAYSGTCGAIFEGARMGIPGLAISTDVDNLMKAPEHLDKVWEYIKSRNLYASGLLFNVNIPPCPEGISITRQGGMYYSDTFVHKEGQLYVQSGEIAKDLGTDPTSDILTVRRGEISITPLSPSRTNMSAFEKLTNEQ